MPIKNLYHVFTDLKRNIYTTESLRKFLGIYLEIKNPVIFNIYKYMGTSGINPTFSDYKLSRYMKFSNHFFTYFLKGIFIIIIFNFNLWYYTFYKYF